MRTAVEMYNYCLENGYGEGQTRNWALKHFQVLVNNLRDDETVLMTFIGLANFVSMSKHDNNYAYAITNHRIMFGQKKMFGEDFKSVLFDRINDISSSTGIVFGTVTIDTLGERFNVGVNKYSATNISNEVHRIIFDQRINNSNASDKQTTKLKKEIDSVDEIRRYKELLDEGIITEEDFNQKKKNLLGL